MPDQGYAGKTPRGVEEDFVRNAQDAEHFAKSIREQAEAMELVPKSREIAFRSAMFDSLVLELAQLIKVCEENWGRPSSAIECLNRAQVGLQSGAITYSSAATPEHPAIEHCNSAEFDAMTVGMTQPPERIQAKIPLYLCTKRVRALKIKGVIKHSTMQYGETDKDFEASDRFKGACLMFDSAHTPIPVDAAWYHKHTPTPGGYYVIYDDGYKSYSPAKAFEGGYVRIME